MNGSEEFDGPSILREALMRNQVKTESVDNKKKSTTNTISNNPPNLATTSNIRANCITDIVKHEAGSSDSFINKKSNKASLPVMPNDAHGCDTPNNVKNEACDNQSDTAISDANKIDPLSTDITLDTCVDTLSLNTAKNDAAANFNSMIKVEKVQNEKEHFITANEEPLKGESAVTVKVEDATSEHEKADDDENDASITAEPEMMMIDIEPDVVINEEDEEDVAQLSNVHDVHAVHEEGEDSPFEETQIERKRRKYREYAARAKERKRLKALGFQVPTRSKEIIPGETREERRRRLNRLRKAKSRQKLRAERGTVGDHSLFGEGVFDDEGLVRCDAVTGEEGQLRGDTIAGANGNDVLLHGADGLPGGPDDDRPYEGHSGHWLIDGILGEDFVGGGGGQGHAAGDDGASGKPRGRRKKAEDQKFYWQDPVTGEYIEETYDERKKRLNRESKARCRERNIEEHRLKDRMRQAMYRERHKEEYRRKDREKKAKLKAKKKMAESFAD